MSRVTKAAFVAGALLPLLHGSSRALEAAGDQDLLDGQCVAVLLASEPDTPPERKAILQASVFYFYGKLKGRHPDLDLAQAMTAGTKDIADDGEAARKRCYGELRDAGRGMKAAGKHFKPE